MGRAFSSMRSIPPKFSTCLPFLAAARRDSYGCYAAAPTSDELARFFHLTDDGLAQIGLCRGGHNRLGFALQLTTVRFLTLPAAARIPFGRIAALARFANRAKARDDAPEIKATSAPPWSAPNSTPGCKGDSKAVSRNARRKETRPAFTATASSSTRQSSRQSPAAARPGKTAAWSPACCRRCA